MMTNLTNWTEASLAVQSADTILIVTHISPDGDAIGSLLGLGNALRSMGKSVDCALDDGVLDYLKFLPSSETVLTRLERGSWDLMISVDASDEERTGMVGMYGRAHAKVVINLDHHATNTLFGDIFLVNSRAVSATEVIYEWLKTMNFSFSPEVSSPLLTGLVTDTLGFRTSNVTANTLGIAQNLMQHGASLTEITERTLDSKSYQTINLWKYALASVELLSSGVIVGHITQQDIRSAGVSEMSDGGLVQFLIKVNEAMVAAVFKENDDNTIGMSFRSKPGFDVAKVAFSIGGGGHKQASGATVPGTLEEVKQRVLPLLIEAVAEGKLIIA